MVRAKVSRMLLMIKVVPRLGERALTTAPSQAPPVFSELTTLFTADDHDRDAVTIFPTSRRCITRTRRSSDASGGFIHALGWTE